MIRADDAGVGVDALSAAAGLEREVVHAGDLAHDAVHAVEDLQQALDGGVVLQRMEFRELRDARDVVVHLRAVFHGAGAHHVRRRVDAHGHLRQAGEVAYHRLLRDLRQARRGLAAECSGDAAGGLARDLDDLRLGRRREEAALAGRAELHDQRLGPAGGVELLDAARHDTASLRAAARRSMAARSWISVTQKRALWPRAGKAWLRSLPPMMPRRSRRLLMAATVFPVRSKLTTNSLKNAPLKSGAFTPLMRPRRSAA